MTGAGSKTQVDQARLEARMAGDEGVERSALRCASDAGLGEERCRRATRPQRGREPLGLEGERSLKREPLVRIEPLE